MNFYILRNEFGPHVISIECSGDVVATVEGVDYFRSAIEKDVKYTVVGEGVVPDLIATDLVGVYVISDAMRRAFEESSVSGCKLVPIVLSNRSGKWYRLVVLGTCGPVKKDSLGYVDVTSSDGATVGFAPSMTEWSGDDIFCPSNVALICVASKVAHICETLFVPFIEIVPFARWRPWKLDDFLS